MSDEGVDVLGVLDELDVAERGGDPFDGVDRAAVAASDRSGCAYSPCWVLTTSGHPGQPPGDAAEDARLRVVGVEDVGAQRAEQPHELAERPQVLERVVRAGEGGHVDVADAHRGEVGDVRSGGRHADHLVAGVGEGPQLRPEQPVEAHVGGGEVDDQSGDARVACGGQAGGHSVGAPVPDAGRERSELAFEAQAAVGLRGEVVEAVAALDRGAPQPVAGRCGRVG